MILQNFINRQLLQFVVFIRTGGRLGLFGLFWFLVVAFISSAPVSAAPQPLAPSSRGSVMTNNSPLIMASSPTDSNLQINRQARTIAGYVWSADLGWISFSSGIGVDGSYTLTGVTPGMAGLGEINLNSWPHNARVVINQNNQFEGYGWSKDIGWIHFDGAGNARALSTNAPLDLNQQPMRANVTVDNRTGQMAGYAWNRDLGWVDFAGVKVEPDGRVIGQATIKNTNNRLYFNPQPYNSNVRVAQNGQFSGYAWNDDLGWVSFNGIQTRDGKFPINTPPSKVLNVAGVPIPRVRPGNSAVRLSWRPPASNGGAEIRAYHIQFCKSDLLGNCLPGHDFQPYNSGVPASNLSSDLTNLVESGTSPHHFTFRVAASNEVGLGPFSDSVTVPAGYIKITLTPNQVNLIITPTRDQNFSSTVQNLKIDSNLLAGLDVKLSSASTNNQLNGPAGQTITSTNGRFNTPQAISNDSWGYRINGGAFGHNTTLEANSENSAFSWAQVPPSNAPDVIFSSNSLVNDRTIPIYYGAKVSKSKLSGNYSATVLYQVIGR